LIKDKLIGVINITDKQTGHRFTKDDMRLLDFLSSQIALNYRRIQLYERFKRVVKETQTLKDRLGQSDKEAEHLKKQIHIQEKLATIGKLAGGIAHEFNNPLDGVIRYTNLSIEHVRDDEVVRGYLMEIKKGLKRMANIVKNLLDCSRNELLTHSKVNFKDALDHSISSVQTDLDYKNINVEINMNQEIPPIRDLGLERVLSNLIRNAVDAIDRDGRITIGARCDQDHLTVSVSDTGHGIQASNMEQVFEPFYTTKDIDKGCGLGLTIVGEIIKIYDGKIAIESALNKGTTFTIKVPVE